jgi:hypothetical protein
VGFSALLQSNSKRGYIVGSKSGKKVNAAKVAAFLARFPVSDSNLKEEEEEEKKEEKCKRLC